LSVARPFVKDWDKKGVGVQVIRKFLPKGSRGYRLYLPIKRNKNDRIVIPAEVSSAVKSAGYEIENYVNGIAVTKDRKRQIRIGKLLKDENALKLFSHDPQRSAHKGEYTVVISAHPYDVVGMSTGRRWDFTSCLRLATPDNKNDAGMRSEY